MSSKVGEIPSEHQEQSTLFDWTRFRAKSDPRFACITAIPNGGKREKKQNPKTGAWYSPAGQTLYAEGVERGFPDIIAAVPKYRVVHPKNGSEPWPGAITVYCGEWMGHEPTVEFYAGLFIEMKRRDRRNDKNGGLDDDQVEWRRRLLDQGYRHEVCYSFEEAQAVICAYFDVSVSA